MRLFWNICGNHFYGYFGFNLWIYDLRLFGVLLSRVICHFWRFVASPFLWLVNDKLNPTVSGLIYVPMAKKNDSARWKVFFWVMLFLQTGAFIVLYSREYYARLAYDDGSVKFDDNSWMPYSWQLIAQNSFDVSDGKQWCEYALLNLVIDACW